MRMVRRVVRLVFRIVLVLRVIRLRLIVLFILVLLRVRRIMVMRSLIVCRLRTKMVRGGRIPRIRKSIRKRKRLTLLLRVIFIIFVVARGSVGSRKRLRSRIRSMTRTRLLTRLGWILLRVEISILLFSSRVRTFVSVLLSLTFFLRFLTRLARRVVITLPIIVGGATVRKKSLVRVIIIRRMLLLRMFRLASISLRVMSGLMSLVRRRLVILIPFVTILRSTLRVRLLLSCRAFIRRLRIVLIGVRFMVRLPRTRSMFVGTRVSLLRMVLRLPVFVIRVRTRSSFAFVLRRCLIVRISMPPMYDCPNIVKSFD